MLRSHTVPWRLLSFSFDRVEPRECWYSLGFTAASYERAV